MKIYKIAIIIFFIAFLSILLNNKIYATYNFQIQESKIKIASQDTVDPNKYKPKSDDESENFNNTIKNKAGLILGIMRNLAVIISVITLMIIGVKYILGSVNEKANYKATLIPWIIGFIISLSGTVLVSFIYQGVT